MLPEPAGSCGGIRPAWSPVEDALGVIRRGSARNSSSVQRRPSLLCGEPAMCHECRRDRSSGLSPVDEGASNRRALRGHRKRRWTTAFCRPSGALDSRRLSPGAPASRCRADDSSRPVGEHAGGGRPLPIPARHTGQGTRTWPTGEQILARACHEDTFRSRAKKQRSLGSRTETVPQLACKPLARVGITPQ